MRQQVDQLYQLGRYDEAIRAATELCQAIKNNLGETHNDYSESLHYLASVLRRSGDAYRKIRNYAKAEPLLKEALEISRTVLGEKHPGYGASLTSLAGMYKDIHEYAKAEPLYQNALDIFSQNNQSLNFASSLDNLALLYRLMGNYSKAEPLNLKALEIWRKDFGENHPDYAVSLGNLADLYQVMGEYAKAERLYKKSLEIYRMNVGENHPLFATILDNLSELYRRMGEYAKAEPLNLQALEIWGHTVGRNHPDYAVSLEKLAELYVAMGHYSKAEPLYRSIVEIRREVFGKNDPNFDESLTKLSNLYNQLGDYSKAEPLYKETLEVRRNTLGENHPAYATSLNELAEIYRKMGYYSKAEPLYKEALEFWLNTVGENHRNYNTILNNLAVLYDNKGDYAKAESLLQQALEVRRATLGENDIDYAQSLNNLAWHYSELGDYIKSEPLQQQALQIWHNVVGENHQYYGTGLNGLADLYRKMGYYSKAEPLYKEALDVRRRTVGEKHPNYAITLSNLGVLYSDIGDYHKAESQYLQALEIWRITVGENHRDYAQSLNILAELYRNQGDYAKAEPLYEQALEIRRKVLGENHPAYATSLNNLAMYYMQTNLYTEAEELLDRTSEILRINVGKNHPNYATAIDNMAFLYDKQGDYAKAEPLHVQALEIRRKVLGENHPLISSSLNTLAILYAATRRQDEAVSFMKRASEIDNQMIEGVFSIGSERQRMAYLGLLRWKFHNFMSLVLQYFATSQANVRSAIELVLQRKSLGAEALAAQRDAILNGKYGQLEPELKELRTLRMQISKKMLAGPELDEDLVIHEQVLREWIMRKEGLEAELAHKIPEINLEQKLRSANLQMIVKHLPKGAALIEFVKFLNIDFNTLMVQDNSQKEIDQYRYVAFILKAGEIDSVYLIDLGKAERIDKLILKFRNSITGFGSEDTGGEDMETGYGLDLRSAVFDPLKNALGYCRRLFIATDDELTRLPFEVLPIDDKGSRLIDDYQISYLSTGRDLLRFGMKSTRKSADPLIIAGPDFDFGDVDTPLISTELSKLRGRQSRDFDSSIDHFCPLENTIEEGEYVAESLHVHPWTRSNALEGSLKDYGSPSILHLATHGFFLPDQSGTDDIKSGLTDTNSIDTMVSRLSGRRLENPFLRSGLALAGANTWLKHHQLPDEAEDGILNAEDVSGLDLSNTQLVVLSACETGLGEIFRGEGVLGLRRSFELAGAQTLVMSLWKVPSEQTLDLMKCFYSHLSKGEPCAEALRLAQLDMKRNSEDYSDPFYWGAFICQGNPDVTLLK